MPAAEKAQYAAAPTYAERLQRGSDAHKPVAAESSNSAGNSMVQGSLARQSASSRSPVWRPFERPQKEAPAAKTGRLTSALAQRLYALTPCSTRTQSADTAIPGRIARIQTGLLVAMSMYRPPTVDRKIPAATQGVSRLCTNRPLNTPNSPNSRTAIGITRIAAVIVSLLSTSSTAGSFNFLSRSATSNLVEIRQTTAVSHSSLLSGGATAR